MTYNLLKFFFLLTMQYKVTSYLFTVVSSIRGLSQSEVMLNLFEGIVLIVNIPFILSKSVRDFRHMSK